MKDAKLIYEGTRERQKQVFDSRAGWRLKPVENKYAIVKGLEDVT